MPGPSVAKLQARASPARGPSPPRWTRPADAMPGAPALVLAHGANNDLDYPLLAYLAEHLAADRRRHGAPLQLPLRGARRRALHRFRRDPGGDLPRARTSTCGRALVSAATPVFVGGKSLGGRVAAELVSRRAEGDGLTAAGLVELGYPLHAPGRTDRVNVKPLRHIDVPSLFCIGSRDAFCDLDLLRPVLPTLLAPAELYVVEGGDHSLLLLPLVGQGAGRRLPRRGRQGGRLPQLSDRQGA